MTIYFLDTEPADESFFAEALREHDVRCVDSLEDVESDAEILSIFINSNVTAAFLEEHPNLRLLSTRSHGREHIDLAACAARGVAVAAVPPYGTNTVAEHTFALMFAVARRLRELMTLPRHGRFSYDAVRGMELNGKTLGVIGLGRIGQRVATIAHGFGMHVLGSDVVMPLQHPEALPFEAVTLDDLLARSDVISLHANLTASTYHLINAETLRKCRRGVLIINTARGALVDTQALREALDSGQVGGAGLDVLQDERVMRRSAADIIAADIVKHLRTDAVAAEARDADRLRELEELMLSDAVLRRSNVVFTPHVAFNTTEAVAYLRDVTLQNIQEFLRTA